MARFGRGQPAPQTRPIPPYRGVPQTVPLPAFELGWEFPGITVVSPSVSIPLPAFELGWEFPGLSIPIGLPVFEVGWEFPTISAVVPVNPGDDLTGPGQISLNGFKMGGGTPYGLLELVGADIDMPPVDNGNVANPSSHGAMSGPKLSQPRTITASFLVKTSRDEMRQVVEDFRAATPIAEGDEELSLAIQVLDTIYVTRGAVLRRTIPIDKLYRLGFAKAVLQIECSNPRLYARQLASATVPDGSTVGVTNLGNINTQPLVRCPGPAIAPRLQAARTLADGTEDVRVIEFGLVVADGETLVIDVERGTATINGDSVMSTLTGASIGVPDWVISRAASDISYQTVDGDAPDAVVLWSHAHL